MISKRNDSDSARQPAVSDYSPAIAKAVEWLGDRYLLAKPINAPRRRESATVLSMPRRPSGGRDSPLRSA